MRLPRIILCIAIISMAYPAFGQSTHGSSIDDTSILRPPRFKPQYKESKAAVTRGQSLFRDSRLSTNGRACSSCHTDVESFGPRFVSPYPHAAMNSQARFGVDKMHLDEVIQVCMQGPMRNIPFEWGSPEQMDLTLYLLKVQSTKRM